MEKIKTKVNIRSFSREMYNHLGKLPVAVTKNGEVVFYVIPLKGGDKSGISTKDNLQSDR